MLCVPQIFMDFLHFLQGQSFRLQNFIFCLKMSKLSAFFNLAGKLLQSNAPQPTQRRRQDIVKKSYFWFEDVLCWSEMEVAMTLF